MNLSQHWIPVPQRSEKSKRTNAHHFRNGRKARVAVPWSGCWCTMDAPFDSSLLWLKFQLAHEQVTGFQSLASSANWKHGISNTCSPVACSANLMDASPFLRILGQRELYNTLPCFCGAETQRCVYGQCESSTETVYNDRIRT